MRHIQHFIAFAMVVAASDASALADSAPRSGTKDVRSTMNRATMFTHDAVAQVDTGRVAVGDARALVAMPQTGAPGSRPAEGSTVSPRDLRLAEEPSPWFSGLATLALAAFFFLRRGGDGQSVLRPNPSVSD